MSTMPTHAARVAGAPACAPVLRRLPVRVTEPPYDDELRPQPAVESWFAALPGGFGPGKPASPEPAGTIAVQGTLALGFTPASPRPSTPAPSPRPTEPVPARVPLRLVPELPAEPNDDDEEEERPRRRTPSRSLPPARPWTAHLLQALLEVLAGSRPPAQVRRFTADAVYADLTTKVTRRAVDGRAAGPAPRGDAVRSVHITEPDDGVVEACAVVRRGSRLRAVALRMEGRDGRWQCTALQVG